MSRRLTQQVRALAQRGATKEDAARYAGSLFPDRGQRTDAKLARLVRRYVEGRPRRP